MAIGTTAAIAAGGAALGGLGGALSKKEEGNRARNLYEEKAIDPSVLHNATQNAITNRQNYTGDPTADLQGNAVLGKLFDKGGAMDRANTEEQDLASRGYGLQKEDHEAYGQAAANTARMFGQQEKGLSQSLADRGMGSSGAANIQFQGLQGNKMEQLGGLQRQIADNRMKSNMDRLQQTRQFLGQMGQQGAQGIEQMQNMGIQKAEEANHNLDQAADTAGQYQRDWQSSLNQGQQQAMQGAHSSQASNIFNGAVGGAMTGSNIGANGIGSMFGGGK